MPAEKNAGRSPGDQDLLAQLRQSLGLLRVAFDSTDEVMVIADHNMSIRWANQKELIASVQGSQLCLLVGQSINAFNGNRGLSMNGLLMTIALLKDHCVNSFLNNQRVSRG